MTRAVVLLSGGLDSGTAAASWCGDGHELVLALFADYGQRAASCEHRAARRIAERLGCPFERIELPWLAAAAARAGSAVVASSGARLPRDGTAADPGDDASAQAVWVPARNLVLIAAAAAEAEARGAQAVVVGFNREEAATFPDNSRAFVAAMTTALAHATRATVRVECPTADLDKAAIARRARALGWSRDDFWSCYAAGPEPCGRCESCLRSARAWRAHERGAE